jgi:hypothetical protein
VIACPDAPEREAWWGTDAQVIAAAVESIGRLEVQ